MPFTDAPWSTPESKLSTQDFCSVCLINFNEGDRDTWVKSKCKLPVRSRPGAPYNKNAIRNAIARLSKTKAPREAKRKAARKLLRLAKEAGIQTGEMLARMAR